MIKITLAATFLLLSGCSHEASTCPALAGDLYSRNYKLKINIPEDEAVEYSRAWLKKNRYQVKGDIDVDPNVSKGDLEYLRGKIVEGCNSNSNIIFYIFSDGHSLSISTLSTKDGEMDVHELLETLKFGE